MKRREERREQRQEKKRKEREREGEGGSDTRKRTLFYMSKRDQKRWRTRGSKGRDKLLFVQGGNFLCLTRQVC